jgi:ornithine cyclodeaminase/alanine dehydrogenase-like protein (mu-crystallin family)
MPGLLRGSELQIGTKIMNASTANPSRGLPRADGLVLLFDPVTARPMAILQAAAISALRTAAVSTLAARYLRRAGASMLAVVGAGPLAQAHLTLMVSRLEIAGVRIHDRVPRRAADLADSMRAALGAGSGTEVSAVADVEEAVLGADILVTTTTTTTPYIPYEWLSPGAVAINVSLDDLHEDAYLRADRVYVDDWGLVVEDSQRLLGKLARRGLVRGPGETGNGRPVDGTLGQLLGGVCPGRESDEQIMVVNPFGMAIEDLAIATSVHEVARRRRLGTLLDR